MPRRPAPHRTDDPDPLAAARLAVCAADPVRRDALARAVGERASSVATFEHPGEVLVAALHGGVRFDAVIAPVAGSGLDGPALCRALRDRLGRAGPAVLLLGDAGDDEMAVIRGLEAGASDCLLAPPAPDLLRAKLRALLREPAPVPSPAPASYDGHQLTRSLGDGSSGPLHEARRQDDGRRVALELVRPDVFDDRALLQRFLRETAVLARVRSPRLARLHSVGWTQGRFLLVWALLEKRQASRLRGDDGRVDVGTVGRIGHDACAALAALGEAGLVHRAVSPAALFVDRNGRATLADPGLTLVGPRGGPALHYEAPELLRGEAPSTASDLYALGVSLWELLTGARPFAARTEAELQRSIGGGRRAIEARELRLDVPPALSRVVARLMDPDPAVRLIDPAEAAHALAAARPGSARLRSV